MNGAAALADSSTLETESSPTKNDNHAPVRRIPEPSAPLSPAKPDILIVIGTATADAAIVLAASMLAFHENGRITATLKEAGAEKIARVAQLELDSELENFGGVARREGLCRLRQFLDGEFFWKHGAATGDAVLSNLISDVLEITQKVVSLEKTLRAN
jgi:hypothetical protein